MDFSDDRTPANEDLELKIVEVGAHPEPDGNLRVLVRTSRGELRAILHPCRDAAGAAIMVGGAMGGFEGPANGIYSRIGDRLRSRLTTLRLHYRQPNVFEECVLDVMAGVSLLRGLGATAAIALVGHSFGGAVVIKAGELSEPVAGVAALSPQIFGTRTVERIGKPLLLVHGMRDHVLDHAASEDIYARAVEPKRLVLYADSDHSLTHDAVSLEELLLSWIPEIVASRPGPAAN